MQHKISSYLPNRELQQIDVNIKFAYIYICFPMLIIKGTRQQRSIQYNNIRNLVYIAKYARVRTANLTAALLNMHECVCV